MRLPSLTARVAATVLLSFVAIFALLFGWLWQTTLARETGELDLSLLASAQQLVATLEQIDSDEGARAALAVFSNVQAPALNPDEPPVLTAVSRRDGSARHTHPRLAGLELAQLPPGISQQRLLGAEWRVYAAQGPRWQAALLDDAPARSRWVGWTLFSDLALYLGMALPLVLVPVWWMVRRAMRPLAELSATVAARSPLDTTPLPTPRRWRELAPLQDALERLFERTAAGLAREKAFVHDAAHELRTPLAVMATQAHVLAASEGAAATEARTRLQQAVARASHLTQQLLALAQADHAARAAPQALCLMDTVRDAMALAATRATEQGTELELQGPDHAPLQAEPRALRSIIDNLLDNALRHGGAGGVVVVQVAKAPAVWVLSVADQGPGVPAAAREAVFDRFWRAPGSTVPGSGLGLAIVREAARSLGGSAECRAAAVGARFVVTLPRSLPGAAAAAPPAP
jgi:two-component system, OmpR family, sensor histidine kinase QseC